MLSDGGHLTTCLHESAVATLQAWAAQKAGSTTAASNGRDRFGMVEAPSLSTNLRFKVLQLPANPAMVDGTVLTNASFCLLAGQKAPLIGEWWRGSLGLLRPPAHVCMYVTGNDSTLPCTCNTLPGRALQAGDMPLSADVTLQPGRSALHPMPLLPCVHTPLACPAPPPRRPSPAPGPAAYQGPCAGQDRQPHHPARPPSLERD